MALACLGFGLAGCGGDGDATIVTDDGTVTIDQDGDDGRIEIESSDGSVTISGDSGGELPEGWPSEVEVPGGGDGHVGGRHGRRGSDWAGRHR